MKNFIKSSSILILGDLITKVLSTLYLIPLIRLDVDLGKLNAVLLVPFGLMVTVGTLGLNIILTNEVVKKLKDEDKLKTTLITSTVLLVMMTVVSTLFMLFAANAIVSHTDKNSIYFDQLVMGTKYLSIGVILFSITSFMRAILVALGEFKVVSISYISEQIIKIFIIFIGCYIFILKNKNGPSVYVMIMTISIIVSMISTCILYGYVFVKKKYYMMFIKGVFKFDKKLSKYLFYSSIIVFASSLYAAAFDQIDLMMMNQQLLKKGYSLEELSYNQNEYFTASWKLILIPISTAGSFITVMFRQLEVGKIKNKVKEFDSILTISLMYGILAMIGLFITGPFIYELFYGTASTGILMIQVFVIPFYIVRNLIGSYVVTNNGNTKSIIYSMLVAIISKIIFNYIFFTFFEIKGYIPSSIVAICLSLAVLYYFNQNLFLLKFEENIDKIMIVIKGIVILILCYIGSTFITGMVSSVIINFVLLFVMCLLIMALIFKNEITGFLKK